MSSKKAKIVCHCVGVTDEDIKKAIHSGDDNLEKLKKSLHIASTCKFCVPEIEEILYNEKNT